MTVGVLGHVVTWRGAIELVVLGCDAGPDEPVAIEHAELRWVALGQLRALDWTPADRAGKDRA